MKIAMKLFTINFLNFDHNSCYELNIEFHYNNKGHFYNLSTTFDTQSLYNMRPFYLPNHIQYL